MKTLIVGQNSQISTAIRLAHTQEKGQTVWEDTGLPVEFPISLHETRKRKWIQGKTTWTKTFDDLCREFPHAVKELSENARASWGTGHYIADSDGFPMCQSEDWDSSD